MSQHFLETGQVSNLLEIPPTIAIGHHQLVTPVILGCTNWRRARRTEPNKAGLPEKPSLERGCEQCYQRQ